MRTHHNLGMAYDLTGADARGADQAVAIAHPLDGDRIDFDHWLLAPLSESRGERFVQGLSRMTGIVVMGAAFALAGRLYLAVFIG